MPMRAAKACTRGGVAAEDGQTQAAVAERAHGVFGVLARCVVDLEACHALAGPRQPDAAVLRPRHGHGARVLQGETGPADPPVALIHSARHPLAGMHRRRFGGSAFGAPERAGQRVRHRRFEAGSECHGLCRRRAIEAGDAEHGRLAAGQGAGLVENHGVDFGQPTQRVGTEHQHTAFGQARLGPGDGGRNRQGQGAGAGGHEDR